MKHLRVIVLLLFLFLGIGARGFCTEGEKGEQVTAIQNRIFHRYHEISLGIGYIPDDDFYNVFPLSLGYTFNFTDLLAWEVARVSYMLNVEKDLKKELEAEFGATPSSFSEPTWAIHSSLVVKPLYGKSVFRERTVINHETYAMLGAGVVTYDTQFSNKAIETETAPSLNIGIGQKIFLGQHFSLNLEIKDWVTFREKGTENNFWFAITFGFRFNLSARKTEKDTTAHNVLKYLE